MPPGDTRTSRRGWWPRPCPRPSAYAPDSDPRRGGTPATGSPFSSTGSNFSVVFGPSGAEPRDRVRVVVRVAACPHPETPAREDPPTSCPALAPPFTSRRLRSRRCERRPSTRWTASAERVERGLSYRHRCPRRPPEGAVRRAPDLAGSVDLRPGHVVADVGVVQRAVVHPVVPDPRDLIAGHVRADRERVLPATGTKPFEFRYSVADRSTRTRPSPRPRTRRARRSGRRSSGS